MNTLEKLREEGLVKEFDLKTKEEIFEADFNLLGFFETLRSIDQRLKKEEQERKEDCDD